MLLAAKIALGLGGSLALATAYTFHEGVIRVDVDENHNGGSHVHFWVPATVVPMAFHVVPRDRMKEAAEQAQPWLPLMHAVSKELKHYPNAELVEVRDQGGLENVHVRTHDGKLLIDVEDPGNNVHLACPIDTLEDIANGLEANCPGA
jgi:hypothetical protein